MDIADKIGERPSRKKVDREARRQRILDAAFLLIEEKGVHGMSLHQLAKHLGYTVGALYRYFSSKDALIAELQSSSLEKLGAAMGLALGRGRAFVEAESMESRLAPLFLMRLLVDFYEAHAHVSPAHFRLSSLVMAETDNVLKGEEALRVFGTIQETLLHPVGLVMEGVEQGAFSEGNHVERVMLLWASLHGVMQSRKLARFAPDMLQRDRLVPALSCTMMQGWGALKTDLRKADTYLQTFVEQNPLVELAEEASAE